MTGKRQRGGYAAAPLRDASPRVAEGEPVRRRSAEAELYLVAERRNARSRADADFGDEAQTGPQSVILVEPVLVGRQWRDMAVVLAGCFFAIWGFLGHLPSLPVVSCFASAIAILAVCETVARFERIIKRSMVRRLVVISSVIGLPMALSGYGIANWAMPVDTGIGWTVGIGALATITMLAATLLSGRIIALTIGLLALWAPVALEAESLAAYALLGCGIAAGGLILWRNHYLHAGFMAQRVREEQERLRALDILIDYERTGPGWFWETDAAGHLTYISVKIADVLGLTTDDLIGRRLGDIFTRERDEDNAIDQLDACLSGGLHFQELALHAVTPSGDCWWSVSGRPIRGADGGFDGFRGFGFDLTERRRFEEHAARLAHFDSLTGLANRFEMSQTLEDIVRASRAEKRVCGVFLLDLDRFKQVNDTLGHPAGDALLKQVASRLEQAVDRSGRVGRLGGDEFEVILPGISDRDALARLAQRIIDVISQPYVIEGQRVVIGVSIGIAVSPDDGLSSDAMIRNADLALYAAKDRGRGRYHFYAADLHSDAEERRQLEHDLRDAIGNAGLELYYQPIVHTATERITGFEALLRWNHPALGPISPAKFIPIAEDAGLIAPIGEWALRTACHDLARWPESIRVAVNVSALQFSNPALTSIVTSALAAAQVSPSRLELEITESVFLTQDEGLDAIFAALKGIGVRLALDDFGTGYSSLGYLKKAPFDKIKIDQSFVRGATVKGSRNGAIIASIVSLAEALGMETTAEGVETLDELDLVRVLGCSHIQGFIYEAALSAEAASDRLESGLVAIAQGPRGTKERHHTRSRRIWIHHNGDRHAGRIHNFSAAGAMIEAPSSVPVNAEVRIELLSGEIVGAAVRWCEDGRMGVEFMQPFDMARALQTSLAEDAKPSPRPPSAPAGEPAAKRPPSQRASQTRNR